jgi:transketolase
LRSDLQQQATLRLLEMHFEAGVGHIGGNLSVLPLLLGLMHDVMSIDDRLVLSKGHAAGALYVTLWTLGLLTDAELRTFHQDGTLLAGHPPAAGLSGIEFATGSLGHGLPMACGLALGARLRNESRRIFCVTSDGEWNEGSMWEALIFAVHRQLDGLTVVVDMNGLQGFGRTRDVANLEPLAERFRVFGAAVLEVDGRWAADLLGQISQAEQTGRPLVVLARTTKGSGVSFMEDRMEWHYLPMTAEQYQQAVKEVGG